MGKLIENPETGEVLELINGQWVSRVEAAEDVGLLESIAIGAGRRLDEMAAGAGNLWQGAMQALSSDPEEQAYIQSLRDERAAEQAETARLMAPLEARRPYSQMAGAVIPEALGMVAPARLLPQALVGAGSGALTYQDDPLDQLTQGALMGTAGSLVGFGAGAASARVAGGIRQVYRNLSGQTQRGARATLPQLRVEGTLDDASDGLSAGMRRNQLGATAADALDEVVGGRTRQQLLRDLTPAQRRLAAEGEELGWRFGPGDFNRPAQMVREAMRSHPLTAEIGAATEAHNARLLMRNIARGLGVDAEDLGAGTLEIAETNIEQRFAALHDAIPEVNASPLKSAAADINEAGRRGLVGSEAVDVAKQVLARLDDSPIISGDDATYWRSQLNDAFRRATSPTGRPDQAGADNLLKMQNALDQAIERATPQAQRGLYRQAREQYRLLTALRRGRALRDDGTVNVPTLSNNLRRIYRREYGAGRDASLLPETRDALRTVKVASGFSPRIGDSGTATRLALSQMAEHPVQSLVLSATARPLGEVVGTLGQVSPTGLGMVDPRGYASRVGAAIGRGVAASGGL